MKSGELPVVDARLCLLFAQDSNDCWNDKDRADNQNDKEKQGEQTSAQLQSAARRLLHRQMLLLSSNIVR